MEIKITKNLSNDYYNEVLAVSSNYKKLVKNPKQKIRGLDSQAKILTAISLAFLVIFSIMYFFNRSNPWFLIVVIIFAVALAAGIIYILLINRQISSFKNNDGERTLLIEDDFVELKVGDEKTRLSVAEIQCILINRYSICFLPKNAGSTIIAIDNDYIDFVSDNISNRDLIVDNTSLYQ